MRFKKTERISGDDNDGCYQIDELELFCLLSNRLSVRVSYTRGKNNFGDEHVFQRQSKKIAQLIKDVFDRFLPLSQVIVVEHLVIGIDHNDFYPRILPPHVLVRFLDLLRPNIINLSYSSGGNKSDEIGKIYTELWNIVETTLNKSLFSTYWNKQEETLINCENLIKFDIELAVGSITMIQLWADSSRKRVRSGNNRIMAVNMKLKSIGENIQCFQNALTKQFKYWSSIRVEKTGASTDTTDPNHFRLFLVDSAITNTLASLYRNNLLK